jgi:hypothetical protein
VENTVGVTICDKAWQRDTIATVCEIGDIVHDVRYVWLVFVMTVNASSQRWKHLGCQIQWFWWPWIMGLVLILALDIGIGGMKLEWFWGEWISLDLEIHSSGLSWRLGKTRFWIGVDKILRSLNNTGWTTRYLVRFKNPR